MSKRLDAAVVGEIFVDHILHGFKRWPTLGEEIYCDQYVREIGGGTANTACALAKLGRKTAIYGCVGSDDEVWLRDATFRLWRHRQRFGYGRGSFGSDSRRFDSRG